MKCISFLVMLFFILGNIACSSNESIFNKVEAEAKVEKPKAKSLSLEDQEIIKKYNDKINSLDLRDRDLVEKVRRDSLSEINKIKDDNARSKLQMEIYLSLAMYKEAYELNGKMLKKSFSPARLMHQCELSYYAKRPQKEYEVCHAELASAFEKELLKKPKTDPEYIYGEWWYLLSMYKSGHKEYEIKLKEMLNSIEDEQLKFQFESSYELAVEQVKSYDKPRDD